MKTGMSLQDINLDDIRGITLEERARLVLKTLARTPDELRNAYRKMAAKYHPDRPHGDSEKFKLINEAYEFLSGSWQPKRIETALLANDELVMNFTGRAVGILDFIKAQKEFEEYMRWHRNHFYGKDGIYA